MSNNTDQSHLQKPLRLWPGIVIVVLQWLGRFGIPILVPDAVEIGVLGGLLGGLAIFVWWAFFSHAQKLERWGAIVLMITVLIASSRFVHESISTGMQGMMFFVLAVPVLSLAFVIWTVVSRKYSTNVRRVTMVITILLACTAWTLFRSNGITGEAEVDLVWRWAPSSEEQLMAETEGEPTGSFLIQVSNETEAEWPGFRGPRRDGIIHGVRIETEWSANPPIEMWRRPIGPGCSSFAVHGNLLYTQEQRGEDEIVSCYNITSGEPIWRHSDTARFWDSHAGAGPRGTPTLNNGYVYSLGATGVLNVLHASDGSVLWSRNAASDTNVKIPGWGYTSSPLVTKDLVIVAIASTIVAYDRTTGEARWKSSNDGESYSSPHLFTIDGVEQIVMMSLTGATSFNPTDGEALWEYPVKGIRILQPAFVTNSDVLINAGEKKGMRRIAIKHSPGKWDIEERWKTNRMRPDFNDFVVHKGHVYGFDGPTLACIDVENGNRKWKGGRYGGQLILLADQDLLLVLSEKGKLVLVEASPGNYKELSQFPAIEGKTWNHPVLVGDILLVRNTQEMVAFQLSLKQ